MSIDALISQEKHFVRCILPVSMDAFRLVREFEFQAGETFTNAAGDTFSIAPFAPTSFNTPQSETSQVNHAIAVEAALKAIAKGTLQKVVVSCIKHTPRGNADFQKIFARMAERYANAFIYVLYHPHYGLWMGATPELLLEKRQDNSRTVSLAGTQPFLRDEPIVWSDKLMREQQLVTDFIIDQLHTCGIHDIQLNGPFTAQAGPLVHLKTEITFHASTSSSVLLDKLHPTPAVCGLPRAAALEFIAQHSDFERRLYAGRLSIVQPDGDETHFVNLRCMQVFDNHFELHVGGGIVAGSQADEEWRETEMKAEVLRAILS